MKQIDINVARLLGYRLGIIGKTPARDAIVLSRGNLPMIVGARIGGKICRAEKPARSPART